MSTTRVLAAVIAAFACAVATGADRVRLVQGTSITGDLVETSPRGVTLRTSGQQKKLPVVEIKAILFDNEPPQLTQARINFANGGFETALEKLDEVPERVTERDIVKQEIAFYRVMSDARLALAGERDAKQAAGELAAFVKANRDSFHFYEAVETLGLLATSLGSHKRAEQMYGVVAKAPYKSLQIRGRVLAAEALQSQGRHAEALTFYDSALSIDGGSSTASLGKASSLAATGELEDGLELVRAVLRQADDADEATRAAGYNALGRCYELADRLIDALFAYLHTDLLFASDAETHAEALGRLAELWEQAGKPDAARDALRRLRQRYAASPAARRAG